MDRYVWIINLAGVAAAYCDRKGMSQEASQLRKMMAETDEKLKNAVSALRKDGLKPFLDDTIRPTDRVTWFENHKLERMAKGEASALLGTFVAKVRGGSRARVGVLRKGEILEFLIRFDERPAELLTIIQLVGLIPGQTIKAAPVITAKVPEKPLEGKKPPKPKITPKPSSAVRPVVKRPEPAPEPTRRPRRLPTPKTSDLKALEKEIREIYKEYYARRSPDDVRVLARKLLDEGKQPSGDPNARFLLLREARDLAAKVGDLETAFAASDELVGAYDLDALESRSAILDKARPVARTPEAALALAERYCELAGEAIDRDDYDVAGKSASRALSLARAAKDKFLSTQAQNLRKDISFLKGEYQKVKAWLQNPAKEKQETVGKYLCFVKGDWNRGLPLIAAAGKDALKAVAEQDYAGSSKPNQQVKIGNGWWNLSQKERKPWTKRKILERAKLWYEKALPSLDGLAKARLAKRVESIDRQFGPGPAVNLLRLIDTGRDSVRGIWVRKGSVLVTPLEIDSLLQIPYIPPQEYDLEIVAQWLGGNDGLGIGLASGRSQVMMVMGSWGHTLNGLRSIDGVLEDKNETSYRGNLFPSGKPVTILCSVRRSSIEVTVNRKRVVLWKADYKRVSLGKWSIPSGEALMLCALNGTYHISRITLIPVSGRGKHLR